MTERALILGASGGIGRAFSQYLAAAGWQVTGLSRRDDGLDITDEVSVSTSFARLSGKFDLIFVATGSLMAEGHRPEKSLRGLTGAALQAQFAINAIGPALILKHAIGRLPRNRRAVFVVLSARVGSIGDNRLGGWYSYRAAKAALNQLLHTGAIEVARSHPQAICLALHPGTVLTDLTAAYADHHPTVLPAEAARNLYAVITTATRDQSGGFFDWQGDPIPW